MSIQEHLNKIRNAIKGSEVRESIAKGIETAYDDASENGNANMEVKIARGTHPTLRDRLNEVDDTQQQTTAQLAQKANRTEVFLKENGININDWDEETRGIILDMEPSEINAVLGLGNVKNENLAEKSVTVNKTVFIKKSPNLFNKFKLNNNRLHNTDGVSIIDNPDWTHTSYFEPIEPNQTYTFSLGDILGVAEAIYYDKNFNRIGLLQLFPEETHNTKTFTTGTEHAYVRFTMNKTVVDELQYTKTPNVIPYQEYYQVLDDIQPNLSAESIHLTYDDNDNLSEIVEGTQRTVIHYDSDNNITSVDEWLADEKVTTLFEFGSKNQLVKVIKESV